MDRVKAGARKNHFNALGQGKPFGFEKMSCKRIGIIGLKPMIRRAIGGLEMDLIGPEFMQDVIGDFFLPPHRVRSDGGPDQKPDTVSLEDRSRALEESAGLLLFINERTLLLLDILRPIAGKPD
jgi:hypothetical protein